MTDSSSVQLYEIYSFLAQAMQYPEPEWFNDDFKTMYTSLLDSLEWQDKDQFTDICTDQDLEDLQVEYTRLFITAVPHVIAPPYASAYIDGALNGPTAAATRQFYLDNGLDLTGNDLPDYLISELNFISLLEQEEEESSEKFLAELFRPWFNLFKDDVLKGTTVNYFKTTVQLIDFFTCPEIED